MDGWMDGFQHFETSTKSFQSIYDMLDINRSRDIEC